jgi:hypothetical protein
MNGTSVCLRQFSMVLLWKHTEIEYFFVNWKVVKVGMTAIQRKIT